MDFLRALGKYLPRLLICVWIHVGLFLESRLDAWRGSIIPRIYAILPALNDSMGIQIDNRPVLGVSLDAWRGSIVPRIHAILPALNDCM